MADSKLKLQIVTALDNAGIKATQEQIAGLEKEFSNLNNSAGMPQRAEQTRTTQSAGNKHGAQQ